VTSVSPADSPASVTVATVTVRGVGAGETRLPLVVTALSDEAGSEYDVGETAGATLTVRGSGSGDAPEITDYQVGVDGQRITVAFESDENPVNMEVVVEGPNETTTLTREEFSGDIREGFRSTVEPDEPGEYTITIRQAQTANRDDLLEETGEITRTVTIGGDNETSAGNGTDATNGTAAGNETDAEPDVSRERPACTSADLPDEVTVDGEDISTVPPVESADAERLETTTAEADGEQRRVQLVDTPGDGTADLAIVDRDGDGDLDPTCGQFRTVNPNLEWESWEDAVA